MPSSLRRNALLAAAATLTLAACGGGHHPTRTLVDVLAADPSTQVLATAIRQAGLDVALAGPGPFTVFAPTDAAFTALLAELGITQSQLLADRTLLTQVLQYHVLNGRVARADVPLGKAVTPLAGGFFKVEAVASELRVTDGRNRVSRITATDIDGGNGLVHKIDRVLLPADRDIVQTAQALPDFSILVEAVVAADLVATLSGTGPFTVFAPTNAAFAAALTELGLTKAQLLADRPLLTRVLTYHVLAARVLKADVPIGTPITTVQGETFSVDGTLRITDRNGRQAAITATDVLTRNGVIHVIDRVILPRL
jgi:uncharacterized surface protein with fasciclin (FAS1) repeats